jgi:hypothetical protein
VGGALPALNPLGSLILASYIIIVA